MTFRELFKLENGFDIIVVNRTSNIVPCPHTYGYEKKDPQVCRRMIDCKACWERDVPEKAADAASSKVIENNVDHPQHYTKGGIECIDAIESATENLTGAEAVLTGQVLKYLWRWKWKNGVEDLQKAKWYLDRLISKEKEK